MSSPSQYDAEIERTLAALEPDERDLVLQALEDEQQGKTTTEDLLQSVIYKYPICPIDEFVYSSDYLGLRKDAVFPRIMDLIAAADDPTVREVFAVLGRGAGKSSFTAIMNSRSTYRLLSYRDPSAYFGVLPGINLGIVNMATSKEQALGVVFEKFWNLIKASKFYNPNNIPIYSKVKGHIEFPNNIHAISGSSGYRSYLGYDIYSGTLDECDSYRDTDDHSVSEEIYAAIQKSCKTRFPKEYKLFCISVPQAEDGFIWPKYQEAKIRGEKIVFASGIDDDLDIIVNDPHPIKDPDLGFQGYRDHNTIVVHGATWDVNPKVTKADFAEDFSKNVIIATRDLAAIPPKSQQAALSDPEMVERLANKNRQHPLTEEGTFKEWFTPDPTKDYYLHIDMARSHDAVGIGLCHYEIVRGVVVMDLIHNIDPTKEWELTFTRIEIFVLALKQRGFNLRKVTFDSWQSYMMLERLINAGIPAEIYSVDRTTEAYDTLISTIQMQRLDYYFQARFVDELKHIKLYNGNRYDHDQLHSKDTSDGVAGSVTQCLKAHQGMTLTDAEVEDATHDDVLFDLQSVEVQGSDAIYWRLHQKSLSGVDKIKRRVVRVEASDDDLLMVIGWHDGDRKRLYVDEFLIWENFDNNSGYTYLISFIEALTQQATISAFSVNELLPLEVLSYLKNTGRNVSSPLALRSSRRQTRRVAGVTHTNDTIIRQMVAQIKQNNLTIPREAMLMRDLKEMTYTNQKDRRFACALAAWMDFAARETTYGHTGNALPKSIPSVPAPIFGAGTAQHAQGRGGSVASVDKSIRSGTEIDVIRGKYRTMGSQTIPSSTDKPGQKSLPRSTLIRGPGGHR